MQAALLTRPRPQTPAGLNRQTQPMGAPAERWILKISTFEKKHIKEVYRAVYNNKPHISTLQSAKYSMYTWKT
jgi:hypothetical protein